MILEGSEKNWNKNLQKQALAFDYGMFRDPFWDPVLDLFCASFFKTYFLKRRSKAMDFQACKWGPGPCFEELTWVTSAERCVGTYSVVALSNVKKASRPCLARWYLVICNYRYRQKPAAGDFFWLLSCYIMQKTLFLRGFLSFFA